MTNFQGEKGETNEEKHPKDKNSGSSMAGHSQDSIETLTRECERLQPEAKTRKKRNVMRRKSRPYFMIDSRRKDANGDNQRLD
jgi:hypothetical protein